MTNIKIKHAGKVYDLAVDPEESGLTLKLQVSSLTNVPPDRQKILAKGGPLKDDAILGSMFKEGQTVMMLGTPLEEVIKADDVNVKFIEDGDSTGLVNPNLLNLPSGLINLGNTCYLNSSIQVLYTVDELKRDLQNFHENDPALIKNMKELFEKLKNSNGKEVTPLNFLASVRNTFPQFQERSREGFYKQQDAEEAYSQILNAVISKFPDLEKYMKVEMKSETKCLESGGQDDVKYDFEDSLKLSCHINNSTNFMIDGLKNGLKETIEKNNESLGRNAQYEIQRKITKLPKYLTVHFVRFFWKRETGKKAKIMRKVQFPFQLDVMELVDEQKREGLIKARDEISKLEKTFDEEFRQIKKAKLTSELTSMEQYESQMKEMKSIKEKRQEQFQDLFKTLDVSEGENASSLYDLQGIIAHQGASADSGHYQAFVRDPNDVSGEKWYKFNDDKVTVIDREKIMSLAGGSEGDSALILIYKGVGM